MGGTIRVEAAVSRPLTGSRPRPTAGTLLGRDEELTLISDFLDGVASGDGGALILTGEPGAGKTALLDAAVERATAGGLRVLRASGAEFEADVPFAGLHQVYRVYPKLGITSRAALRDALVS